MSETGDDEKGDARVSPDQAGGVLGNLPHSRPSVRSPRRKAPAPEPARQEAKETAESAPAESAHGTSSQAELEALARTGIAIAGGAASLGLRVAGRAAAALRGAVDRR